jgi:hypothetical protein
MEELLAALTNEVKLSIREKRGSDFWKILMNSSVCNW